MDNFDPVAQFAAIQSLYATQTVPAGTVSAELAPAALLQVASQHTGSEEDALAVHIASHSSLTRQAALAIVENAPKTTSGTPDPAAVSAAASKSASTGVVADIELSNPVMLWPAARALFAGVFAVALFVCLGLVFALADKSVADQPKSAWAYGALAIGAGASLIGLLVLVMGYKNVTIKGGPPSAS